MARRKRQGWCEKVLDGPLEMSHLRNVSAGYAVSLLYHFIRQSRVTGALHNVEMSR